MNEHGQAHARSRLTIKLTDRRALTRQSFKTPRHRSQAQTAVRCSDLVRRRAQHTQKYPVKSVPTPHAARPRYGAWNDNRESREIHEKKCAPVLVKDMNL